MEHKKFMEIAIKEAEKALKKDEVPVGAVCVLNGKVISKGHNMVIGKCDASSHAEIIALRRASKKLSNYRLNGVSIYVTAEPCIMCAGALIHFRVSKLIYGTREPRWGAVESLYRILEDRRLNHRIEVIGGVMEDECRALLQNFFKRKR